MFPTNVLDWSEMTSNEGKIYIYIFIYSHKKQLKKWSTFPQFLNVLYLFSGMLWKDLSIRIQIVNFAAFKLSVKYSASIPKIKMKCNVFRLFLE